MKLKTSSLALLVLAFMGGEAVAAMPESPSDARLLSAVTAHAKEPILAGLAIELAPGWKTYWRNPGDSGIPPSFDWSGSNNVKNIELRWPAPTRFDLEAETIFGYEHEVIFPLLMRAENPAKPLHLELKLSYAICSTLCVPMNVKVALDIPAGISRPTEDAPLLRQALSHVPLPPRNPGGIKATLVQAPKMHLRVECAECAAGDLLPVLIIDGPPGSWFGKAIPQRQDDHVLYEAPVELDPGISLKGKDLKLIFAGTGGAIEIERHLP